MESERSVKHNDKRSEIHKFVHDQHVKVSISAQAIGMT